MRGSIDRPSIRRNEVFSREHPQAFWWVNAPDETGILVVGKRSPAITRV
jgi:hypothetical protein